jgi:hypothetical protein
VKLAVLSILVTIGLGPNQDQDWRSPVREIPVPSLSDIAFASADSLGFVIYYNPNVVRQVGSLAASFFRAHEYAHIYLGHVTRLMFSRDPYNRLWMSRQGEIEADEYATRYFTRVNPAVITAAIRVLRDYSRTGDATHIPGGVRARNIRLLFNKLLGDSRENSPSATAQTPLQTFGTIAAGIVSDLASGRFDGIAVHCTAQLRQTLPAERIARIWHNVTSDLGDFEQQSPTQERDGISVTNVRIGCRFQHGVAQVDVNFDRDGRIAGLWIYPQE